MEYKFYDLGIKGEVIKKRLQLLENINGEDLNTPNGDGGVATMLNLKEV